MAEFCTKEENENEEYDIRKDPLFIAKSKNKEHMDKKMVLKKYFFLNFFYIFFFFKFKKIEKIYFPEIFPNPNIYSAFEYPSVDKSEEKFGFGSISEEKLKQFLYEKIGWSSERIDNTLKPLLKRLETLKKEISTQIEPKLVKIKNPLNKIKGDRIKTAFRLLRSKKGLKNNKRKRDDQKKSAKIIKK